MIISHVTYGFGMGGIETMLANIAHYQAEAGHDVHIVILNDIVEQSLVDSLDPRVTLHLLSRPAGSRNPMHILRLNKTLRRIHPEVVHLHIPSLSRYILLPSLRRRFCVTQHAMCSADNTVGIRRAGKVFAISDMVRRDLHKKLSIEATTIPNGIEMSGISFKPAMPPRPGETFRILQLGRLDHKLKGQDILIRAAAQLIGGGGDISLTFIGDGPSRHYLEALAGELGISNRVEFLGNRPQSYVFSHLADYHLLAQPSRFEGFGLTVVEAMAAGLPVLVADADGPMEVIDGGRFGYHFRTGDIDDCARMISGITTGYPATRALAEARHHVEENYSVRATADRYLEAYPVVKR